MIPEVVPTTGADPFDLPGLCRYFSERSPRPMVAVAGGTHVVRYVNPAFARLAGKATAELVGRPFAEAVPEGTGNGCGAVLDRVFRTGTPEDLAEQEHRQTPSAYWSYAMWAILGADGRPAGVMIQVTDATETTAFRTRATAMNEALLVSSVRQHELLETIERGERERRDLEAQMFQAQKLESLGVLAGGIAHDLNNMLTPVLGFTELASNSLPEGSPAAPLLAEVETNVRRAADLVQQILAYAGKGRFVLQPVDLSRLVRDMAGLLGSAVAGRADLGYDLAPALPPVEADLTQLRQVVLNLVTNAAEAVAAGGTITIRTGRLPTGHPTNDLPGGPAVFLEVSDTGCGMAADVIGKIFDPFFTTKFTGRGLGLAVVQGVARGHGGAVQVHSEPGRGSTFRLLLPCGTTMTAAAAPVIVVPVAGWRGTGTVLVIDDEKGVRDLTTRLLERAGLTVVVAEDGEAGLRVFGANHPGIDAVLLDLTMPRLDGLATARALRALRPDLPIVLMSGYTVEEVSLQSAGVGIAGFVQKPFALPALLAAVRQALGR